MGNIDATLVAILGVVLLLAASMFGFILFFVREFLQKPSNQAQNDVTNMMILFQTMRDLLSEQKDLARQFNQSMDQKVKEVRTLLEGKDEVQNLLLEAKRDIANLTQNTKRELASLQRRAGVPATPQTDEAPKPAAESAEATEQAAEEDEPKSSNGTNGSAEPSAEGNGKSKSDGNGVKPLRAVPEEPPVDKRDMIDAWTGVDFGTPETHDEPAHVIEEPGDDSDSTRDAMRSLLNVQSPTNDDHPVDPFNADEQESQNNLTPIQMRVYEYADAGMRVPEIARELGVGKGEIRLILSLRKGQRR